MLDMLKNIERDETAAFSRRSGISLIGHSNAVAALRQMVMIASQLTEPVGIIGADSYGNADIAAAIHQRSNFAEGRFIHIDCRIANTSFKRQKFQGNSSQPATYFLDEFAQLDQNRRAETRQLCDASNIRLIISGGHEMAVATAAKELGIGAIMSIPVPSLASRKSDIPLLIEAYIQSLHPADRFTLERAALNSLKRHEWAGNLYELREFVRRAGRKFGGKRLNRHKIEQLLQIKSYSPPQSVKKNTRLSDGKEQFDLRAYLAQEEVKYLKWALADSSGVIQRAADRTGLKRTTFLAKMRKYGLG